MPPVKPPREIKLEVVVEDNEVQEVQIEWVVVCKEIPIIFSEERY